MNSQTRDAVFYLFLGHLLGLRFTFWPRLFPMFWAIAAFGLPCVFLCSACLAGPWRWQGLSRCCDP